MTPSSIATAANNQASNTSSSHNLSPANNNNTNRIHASGIDRVNNNTNTTKVVSPATTTSAEDVNCITQMSEHDRIKLDARGYLLKHGHNFDSKETVAQLIYYVRNILQFLSEDVKFNLNESIDEGFSNFIDSGSNISDRDKSNITDLVSYLQKQSAIRVQGTIQQ